MRWGIDARLNAYRYGGIAQYTRQLLAALAPLLSGTGDTVVTLQHHKDRTPMQRGANVQSRRLVTPPHHRLEQWSLPLELAPLQLDVLHCPDFIAPRLRPYPAVITIHDLAFLRYPEILDDAARRYYGQIRAVVRHVDAIIAVSEATRCDIAELLDVPIERIDRVYEAAAAQFRPAALPAGARRLINGQIVAADTFILFVSTVEPRKNLPTLLRALQLACARQPAVDLRLVVAGARGWLDAPTFDLVRDLGLGERVLFLGGVGQSDLLWLYNACRIYANPSLYEGFGLPVVEALACAAPAVVADTSSLPEVAGTAARLVPPLDIDAWATTLAGLWEDAQQRRDLAERGPAQAAQFSWQRAAAETLAIYQRVAR